MHHLVTNQMIDITKLTPDQLDRFINLQALIYRQAEDAERVKAARDWWKVVEG